MSLISPKFIFTLWKQPSLAYSLSHVQWTDFLLILRDEKMLSRVAFYLKQELTFERLPVFVQRHFHNALIIGQRHSKQVHYELQQIKQVCDARAQQWVVLKGAAYTASQRKVGEGRIYNDIDILVDKSSIESCEHAFLIRGWLHSEIDNYDEDYYRQWTHEIPPLIHSDRGTVMDLHHNIVPPVSGRAPDMSLLLSETVFTADNIPVLSLPAQALHSAIHLFFNEECQYACRDIFDLYLLFNEFAYADWHRYVSLAKTTGFADEARLALYFVQERFGSALSSEAFKFMHHQGSKNQSLRTLYTPLIALQHPKVATPNQSIARTFVAMRGHLLKMPMTTLLYHVSIKTYRALAMKIFGEHIFTKQDVNSQRTAQPQPAKPRFEGKT